MDNRKSHLILGSFKGKISTVYMTKVKKYKFYQGLVNEEANKDIS